MGLTHITLGYVPLMDAAVLIAAAEAGFAESEGVELSLVRETSWANIRDRVAIGHFDAAHMLAPMPLSANLGLTPLAVPHIAPMALGLGGNAITVSKALAGEMSDHGLGAGSLDAARSGTALAGVVANRRKDDRSKLRFAVVHPESGHNYELRYWLAAAGIYPDRDIEIIIVPPSFQPDALAAGEIDGFCVGEPFNSLAVARGAGRIVTTKSSIWRSSPEKVLGLRATWAQEHPEMLKALIRALTRAARWSDDPANTADVARMLGDPQRLDLDAHLLEASLAGKLKIDATTEVSIEDFFMPFARAANFPWTSHALWFYAQMVRWGQVAHTAKNARIAAATFRPDLFRAAVDGIGIAVPAANAKVEGALEEPADLGATQGRLTLGPDGFFDGTRFDPDEIDIYIAGQAKMLK